MKILVILSALLTAFISINGVAVAGVQPKMTLPAPETSAVMAMRTLLTRCMPGIIGGARPNMTGFDLVAGDTGAAFLGDHTGSVWKDSTDRVVVVSYADMPVCKVIALTVDPAVLADIVIRVFREADTPFERARFRLDEDGGFAAIYTGKGLSRSVVVRIHTARRPDGSRFGTLTIEDATPLTD